MSPTEQYVFLRQAGFSHNEAHALISRGVVPKLTTELRRLAYSRWVQAQKKG